MPKSVNAAAAAAAKPGLLGRKSQANTQRVIGWAWVWRMCATKTWVYAQTTVGERSATKARTPLVPKPTLGAKDRSLWGCFMRC
jgi:hypothetical protein